MAEIDTPIKYPPPDMNKRESRATACSLCVWVIVLTFCWVFITMEHDIEGVGSALAFLVMLPLALLFLVISIYKIGKALLNLYKHR
jgi:apolipoprotein N-acyltransferase